MKKRAILAAIICLLLFGVSCQKTEKQAEGQVEKQEEKISFEFLYEADYWNICDLTHAGFKTQTDYEDAAQRET